MVRNAQATRQRLLDAAAKEFATYGIAGARVDRIAEAAQSNKAQIYHYFDSKEALFDAVFNAICVESLRATPIDVTDLPSYAGRILDGYEDHPEVSRLARCPRPEGAGSPERLSIGLASLQDKAGEIAQAQNAGLLSSH